MKKFTTLLTMAFIALMSISFTSCDDDSDIAYTLDGTWKGNMLVEYGNHNALYSVIRFDQNDGFYSGTGYWIDYFDRNYWHGNNYIANRITWTVRNRNIYITLLDEGSDVVIYDYALGDSKQYSGLENTQIVSRGAKDSVEYVKVADDNQKPVRRFVVK